MFWLLKFFIKTIIRLQIIAVSVAAGMAIAYGLQLREQSRSWGVASGDAANELAGDDLVADPDHVDTRSLSIDAAAGDVWPWIAQLGYGRGGWYSYAPIDRPWSPGGGSPGSSADSILPEYQDLDVGDIVPTHRSGGFEAKVVEADEALVLYLDDTMVREQLQQSVAEHAEGDEETSEAVSRMENMPAFRLSWAFILEPEGGGSTRLIERFRVHMDLTDQQRMGLPFMGLGVFALMRSQMLGIKQRVETSGESLAA